MTSKIICTVLKRTSFTTYDGNVGAGETMLVFVYEDVMYCQCNKLVLVSAIASLHAS